MVDPISSDNCVVNSTFNKPYCYYTSGPNTPAIFSDNKNQSITSIVISIVISAIVFHMMWGAIFGFIVSSLLRIKVLQSPGIKE
jgi:hypothetical protein